MSSEALRVTLTVLYTVALLTAPLAFAGNVLLTEGAGPLRRWTRRALYVAMLADGALVSACVGGLIFLWLPLFVEAMTLVLGVLVPCATVALKLLSLGALWTASAHQRRTWDDAGGEGDGPPSPTPP